MPAARIQDAVARRLRYFGMKAHTGVDAESGLVHSAHATAANESDVAHTHELLHGQEQRVHADAGYTGGKRLATAS